MTRGNVKRIKNKVLEKARTFPGALAVAILSALAAIFSFNQLLMRLAPGVSVDRTLAYSFGFTVLAGLVSGVYLLRWYFKASMKSEKMSAVGQLVAGVAHEINNPLTAVVGLTDLLLEDEKNLERRQDLQIIKDQSMRCSNIIMNLLQFARQHKPEKKPVNINQVLEKSFSLLAYNTKSSSVCLEKELDPALPEIIADPNQLQQVFLNLIQNSRHALKDRPNPSILLKTERLGGKILIHVRDNGCGIPPESIRRVFDPFFTTKAPGEGTGMGLSISFGIVRDHDGDIRVESEVNNGTCFTVELPDQNQ